MKSIARWSFWIGTAVVTILVLTQPVSVRAQFALSTGVIVMMIALWRFGQGPLFRQVFITIGSFVVLRYMYWRATNTLPPISDVAGFSVGFMLFMAELYCLFILSISLIINADPLKREALPRDPDEELPNVDVFIPTYNEDEYILATTVAAANSMDYPAEKLTVWLLDDGGSDQKCNDPDPVKSAAARQRRASLIALCETLGANYLTRAKNEHAKAGNLNNGLRHSTGEIVVVFDADHAPFRTFLRETVGYFARDPKLFLVQTPHVFLNPDPIEKNLRTFDRMPSENEMFYSVTQCGLDKWNGSFFCGSAALLRRAALETTGGFSGITITEDCETAVELHAKGWTSVYVDKPLIAGLQPETFAAFIGQRSRWCQGMLQILILKNPAFKKGLKFIQRVAYLSSMTFWLFPVARMIFLFAPLVYIFFDIKIFVSNFQEAVAYAATYMVVNLMLQNCLYGRFRWPWMSELYEYTQSVYLAKAIVSVIVRPRKPTFNVTAKGLSLDTDRLSELALPYFIIYGVLMLGALTAAYRYAFEPGVGSLMLVVGIWNGFNLVVAGTALGVVAERKQPHRHSGLRIDRRGILMIGDAVYPVAIENVSAGGCALRSVNEAFPGNIQTGRLTIDLLGTVAAGRSLPVRSQHASTIDGDTVHGFEFDGIEGRDYYVLADLMYGDAEALGGRLRSRRTHKDLFSGTWQFLIWGVTEPIRAFGYVLKSKPIKARPKAEPALPGFDIDVETDRMVYPLRWLGKLLKQPRPPRADQDYPVSASRSAALS